MSTQSLPRLDIPALRSVDIRRAIGIILILSAVVFAFLFWLVYLKQGTGTHNRFITILPTINAGLNSLSTIFLISGFVAIMKRKLVLHMRLMFAALCSSAAFFVCYVIYHNAHGDTLFPHIWIRPLYLAILISHIVLSGIAVPLILGSFYLSLSGRYALHRKVSRFTFPIWLYVSVTGVVVYLFLRVYVG